MTYREYTWSVDIRPIIPPIGRGLYRFEAKITFVHSPTGKLLWKYWKYNDGGKIGIYLGGTEKEAEDRAAKAMRKWIDDTSKKKANIKQK